MPEIVSSFYVDGVHSPLSNFYECRTVIDGKEYVTLEHYFQSMKTVDLSAREQIRLAPGAGHAKRLGRKCELRSDWEAVKLAVMRNGLLHKFDVESKPGRFLLDTGDAFLIEGNTWGDRFWGQVNGEGQNWLGHLLMARRAELRWWSEQD